MNKNIKIFLNDKEIIADIFLQESFLKRFLGLMFQCRPKSKKILIFKNAPWIHSFFCFFKFDVVFLDSNYNVIAYKNNIPPFLILKPVFDSKYTLEIVNCCFDIEIGDKMIINEH